MNHPIHAKRSDLSIPRFGPTGRTDPREVQLDMPVELTFRKMHDAGGTPNYYWKCTPVR